MSLVTQEIRAKATYIYHGNTICQEKTKLLLIEMGLPNGLITIQDIKECGYVKETGFVWLKQEKPNKTKNEKSGTITSNAMEVTAFIEKFRIKKLTGVRSKELLMWITVSDIIVDNPPTGIITFKTSYGLYQSYLESALQIKDEKKDVGGVGEAKVPK